MRLPLTVGALVLSACQPALPVDDPHWVTQTKTIVARNWYPNLMLLVDRSASMGVPIDAAAAQCPAGCGVSTGPCPASCPTRMSEVAAGLGSFLDVAGAELRGGLAVFPSLVSADACGATDASDVLVPLSSSNDVAAELTATTGEIKQRLGTLSPAGQAPTAASLRFLGDQVPLQQPTRDDFVLLVTGAIPGCNADATAAATELSQRGIRTIVVGVGAEVATAEGLATLDAMARAGGFRRQCRMGTDAECGANNTCETATGTCRKAFFQASNATELSTVLSAVVARVPGIDVCSYELSSVPTSAAFVRVIADQAEVPADQPGGGWELVGAKLTLKGTLCARATNATSDNPLPLELHVFKL